MDWIKKYWWVLLIGVIVAPLVINWVILQPQQFDVVGDGTHWLGFWATYISAIASFAMVFITRYTLKQNKEQLDELKNQWEEQNKPDLVVGVLYDNKTKNYDLIVHNIGNKTAENIAINLQQTFIDQIYECILTDNSLDKWGILPGHKSKIEGYIKEITSKKFNIQKKQYKRFPFIHIWHLNNDSQFATENRYTNSKKLQQFLIEAPFEIGLKYNNKYKQIEVVSFNDRLHISNLDNDNK